jgi:hypothetical protein
VLQKDEDNYTGISPRRQTPIGSANRTVHFLNERVIKTCKSKPKPKQPQNGGRTQRREVNHVTGA